MVVCLIDSLEECRLLEEEYLDVMSPRLLSVHAGLRLAGFQQSVLIGVS